MKLIIGIVITLLMAVGITSITGIYIANGGTVEKAKHLFNTLLFLSAWGGWIYLRLFHHPE